MYINIYMYILGITTEHAHQGRTAPRTRLVIAVFPSLVPGAIIVRAASKSSRLRGHSFYGCSDLNSTAPRIPLAQNKMAHPASTYIYMIHVYNLDAMISYILYTYIYITFYIICI